MKADKKKKLHDTIITAAALISATVIGAVFSHFELHESNIVISYIFSVLLISRFTNGYLYGILSAVISLLLFNWFFTEPYFTLKVNDPTYFITFGIMMLTAVFTSTLTTKAKQSAEQAREREQESNTLYQITNHLTDAEDNEAIAKVIVTSVSDALKCITAFIFFDENGLPEKTFIQRKNDKSIVRRELKHPEELKRRMEQLHSDVDITEEKYLYPIYGNDSILAVLSIPSDVGEKMTDAQKRMLHSIIESSTLAIERLRSLQEQARSREEATQERYRGNLLRAISHDIRTPLSGIMGTSEMLMSATQNDDPRYLLAENIFKDARWLHDMVENILNLTKLQDGKLVLNKQSEAIEEVIGAALGVMEKRLPERSVDVEMPDNVIMAPMDARLISQVLINLLDNAGKHTPTDKPISIFVTADDETVKITVADRGFGIAENDLPNIFKMFYTTSSKIPDAKRGVGLGLAICQSIIEAHKGSITAQNREGGGAEFTFTLPLGDEHYD